MIAQPRTVIAWQRKRFREYWTRLSRQGQRGRPPVAKEIRDLIRNMSATNPTWGSPRIMAELLKLGIEVAKSTVEKYRVRRSMPPSPTWRTFLATHAKDLVAIDEMDSSCDLIGIDVPKSLASTTEEEPIMSNATLIAVDLAKSVFEIVVSRQPGNVAKPRLRKDWTEASKRGNSTRRH